mmetsp:Transcript_27687/g.38252  ORF Transcript_27687/g.38252 Transcript_27687/m.38252 type:complete len:459 (-) Transcript_27687:212-1588(-)|eukprot:CAMPEP_0196583412 /NCGR_PEP_ID=MMETSP1081-20130531/43501_1 /TAXON_ID=36882 /ORGANISM="Pyramimonas amylifera, Strain CCMP720" /LENGTH=458 /DNA_ID=CAMNT_0041904299 /DNA_START=197 /DNA_END=1573 /DNA_ORIENTATION=+
MDQFYYIIFAIILLMTVGVELKKTAADGNKVSQEKVSNIFAMFRNNYLVVYSLMMAGDWLQGPYVYALYQYYNYSKGDIGKLFIAGFGSSMIFGTVVGSLADKYGRKKAALTYVITYMLSCATKHSPNYWILMLGRFFGGIATSLLFSAFESWLVAEHFKRGFEAAWLSQTFSKAIFLGNGLVAIVSGLLANFLVDNMELGPVIPFDCASVFLGIGGLIIFYTWSENYGDSSENTSLAQQFSKAASAIASDQKIALLGAMQALFEGSMYTFVFLWTPALAPRGEDIPHGFIFASFMLACMLGSSFAAKLMSRPSLPIEKYMQYVFALAAVALLVPVWFTSIEVPGSADVGGITFEGKVQLLGFLLFEICVGIFWPSIMSMRSRYIPEDCRSTIMNFFRMPLNLFVCVVLYNVSSFPIANMFAMCSAFLLAAAACQYRLCAIASSGGFIPSNTKEDDTI